MNSDLDLFDPLLIDAFDVVVRERVGSDAVRSREALGSLFLGLRSGRGRGAFLPAFSLYATYIDGGDAGRRRCTGLGRFELLIDDEELMLGSRDGVLAMVLVFGVMVLEDEGEVEDGSEGEVKLMEVGLPRGSCVSTRVLCGGIDQRWGAAGVRPITRYNARETKGAWGENAVGGRGEIPFKGRDSPVPGAYSVYVKKLYGLNKSRMYGQCGLR